MGLAVLVNAMPGTEERDDHRDESSDSRHCAPAALSFHGVNFEPQLLLLPAVQLVDFGEELLYLKHLPLHFARGFICNASRYCLVRRFLFHERAPSNSVACHSRTRPRRSDAWT